MGRERPMVSLVEWREWPVPRHPWDVRRACASMVGCGGGEDFVWNLVEKR